MHTQIALKIYALKKMNVIKSNAFFWNNFSRIESIENMQIDTKKYEQEINQKKLNLVWIFDENFPKIQTQLSKSERPYFFAYKGDLNLLNQLHKNIAVIGSRRINQDIEEREKQIVQLLCEQDFNIVSGLAKGCDTIAHQISLEQNKKTIATLPCEIPDIYPPENINLANAIAQNGGLLISEYVTTPKTHLERKARFIERDRLQALFSNAVILIASQMRKNNGSKYAMQKAIKYHRQTFAMYNNQTDANQEMFEMNKVFINKGTKILNISSLKEIKNQIMFPIQFTMPFMFDNSFDR